MRAFFILSVLFALGCSGALVPPASQGGGSVFDADGPFPDDRGGSDGPSDGSDDTDDVDTGAWDTGSWDTGSWDTGDTGEPGECPFSGDSTGYGAYYELIDDDCGWGSDGFGGDVGLTCNGDGTFTLDDDVFGVAVECTLDGQYFECVSETEYTFALYGAFYGAGRSAEGSWYLDVGGCYGAGEFVWE